MIKTNTIILPNKKSKLTMELKSMKKIKKNIKQLLRNK